MEHLPQIILLLALLGVSGFFSGSETALFSLRTHQIRSSRSASLRLAGTLLRQPRDLLITILLGNMFVNVAFFSVSVGLALHLGRTRGQGAAAGASIFFLLTLILLGEVIPKGVAARAPRGWARLCAYPLTILFGLSRPVHWLLGRFLGPVSDWISRLTPPDAGLTTEELRMMVELSETAGVLHERENYIMQRVVELREMRVKEVMVPRVDMRAFDLSRGREAFLADFKRHRNSRVPVYRESIDEIQGVLHAKEVHFSEEEDLSRLVRKVPFIPETKTVESLLRQFREGGQRVAIVVDEYGGTEGLVTLEDILEAIVGEIEDEYDRGDEPVRRISESAYLLEGDLGIREWRQISGVDLPSQGVETLGGFIVFSLGRLPREGDQVVYRNIRFTVQKMLQRRVGRIRVEVIRS
jgi:putative hemolysin